MEWTHTQTQRKHLKFNGSTLSLMEHKILCICYLPLKFDGSTSSLTEEGHQADKQQKQTFLNERTTGATPSRVTLHSHSLTCSHLLQSISRFGGTLTSSHPPNIFHISFLNMFHIFSLGCFLIYGVNRRKT